MTDQEYTINNLIELKRYWEVSRDKITLFMKSYSNISDARYDEINLGETNLCGTNCCLLGLAPEIFLANENHIENGYFSYELFGYTYFPYLYIEGYPILENELWKYLFHPEWPDDLDHALERMHRVIDMEIDDTYTEEEFSRELALTRAKYNMF